MNKLNSIIMLISFFLLSCAHNKNININARELASDDPFEGTDHIVCELDESGGIIEINLNQFK